MDVPNSELLSVELSLWHPGCWTTEVTEETGVGVVGHGSVQDGRRAYERCTVYGDTEKQVRAGVETAKESDSLDAVRPLHPDPVESTVPGAAIGTVSQDVFIEYSFTDGVGPALASHGFVLDGVSRMEHGRERWPLLIRADRRSLTRHLDEIRRAHDARIDVRRIEPASHAESIRENGVTDELTPRQREAFELARERGYYEWPRETDAATLASELGVAKSTFLEHLRSAESRLLDPES